MRKKTDHPPTHTAQTLCNRQGTTVNHRPIFRWATAALVCALFAPALSALDQSAPALTSAEEHRDSWRRALYANDPLDARFILALDALNGTDPDDSGFIDDAFSTEFHEFQTRQELIDTFRAMRERFGAFQFVRILRKTDREIACEVRRENDHDAHIMLIVRINPGEENRIDAIHIGAFSSRRLNHDALDTWSELADHAAALDSDTAITILELEDDLAFDIRAAINADTPMAIGPAMRIFALGALAEHLNNNALPWSEPVECITNIAPPRFDFDMRSTIEGQTIPARTLARRLMINQDSFAIQAIANFIGPEDFEAFFTLRTTHHPRLLPFLSARDYLTLRHRAPRRVLENYARADQDERARLLKQLDEHHKSPIDPFPGQPPAAVETVGWFASSNDLAILLAELWTLVLSEREADRDARSPLGDILFADNTLPGTRRGWPTSGALVAEENGILTTMWFLEHNSGRRFIVTLIQNNTEKPIENRPAALTISAALELLDLESQPGGVSPDER